MHDLSLHILDLIENSLHANSTIVAIHIHIDEKADELRVRVEDNGKGIQVSPERATDPFFTTNGSKKVGLGLSFFKAAAEMAGGRLILSRSQKLGGASVTATMGLTHVDRPPLGDLAATISTMILMNPELDFRLSLRSGDRTRTFQLSEFMERRGLRESANVELANSVFEALQTELEPWDQCELITCI